MALVQVKPYRKIFYKRDNKNRRRVKRLKIAGTLFVIVILLMGSVPLIRASVLMPIASAYELKQASPTMHLEIPRSDLLSWFPHMLVYQDKGGYNNQFKTSVDLTIYYTFGAFDTLTTSRFYDEKSPYYSAFYGGYVVEHAGEDLIERQRMIETIPSYDYQYLILRDLGCPDALLTFKPKVMEMAEGIDISGYSDWTRYDIEITTRGSAHERQGFIRHDLQFGTPPPPIGKAFPEVRLYGRLYARYAPAEDTLLILYVIAPSEQLVLDTDRESLLKTVVTPNTRDYSD